MRIASACGAAPGWPRRAVGPFRAPHHTISDRRAGRRRLAARARVRSRSPTADVLFLDELAEFSRDALEALRQPLEEGGRRSRAPAIAIELPCRLHAGRRRQPLPLRSRLRGASDCECTPAAVRRYRARAQRRRSPTGSTSPSRSSSRAPRRWRRARARARRRSRERVVGGARAPGGAASARAAATPRSTCAELAPPRRAGCGRGRRALADGHATLGLSGRGHDRVLRLARTIADLDGLQRVAPSTWSRR